MSVHLFAERDSVSDQKPQLEIAVETLPISSLVTDKNNVTSIKFVNPAKDFKIFDKIDTDDAYDVIQRAIKNDLNCVNGKLRGIYTKIDKYEGDMENVVVSKLQPSGGLLDVSSLNIDCVQNKFTGIIKFENGFYQYKYPNTLTLRDIYIDLMKTRRKIVTPTVNEEKTMVER